MAVRNRDVGLNPLDRGSRPAGVGVGGNAMPAVMLATVFGAPWQLSSTR